MSNNHYRKNQMIYAHKINWEGLIQLEKIRERLIESIRQSGMTQTEIAEKLNVSQSNIAHYIRGDIMPALDTFANLCDILDVDPAYILCLED